MKQLLFDNYNDFAWKISNTYESLDDEFKDVSIIAKYEEARHVIKELAWFDHDLVSIDIHDEEYDWYDKEYVISLNQDGIWCEPFFRDDRYINDEATIIYIMDNCSSKVISHCESDFIYEVSIDSNEEDSVNCIEKDVNPEIVKHYTVNGKDVSKEEFDKYVSDFVGEKYKPYNCDNVVKSYNNENIQKSINKLINEMNEMTYLMRCYYIPLHW